MLISNSAVGCWTITRRAAKLKPPAVKQKSFELEREVLRFFKAGRKRGPMDYPSFRWREKSSSGFEFRPENGLLVQVFRNSSVQP